MSCKPSIALALALSLGLAAAPALAQPLKTQVKQVAQGAGNSIAGRVEQTYMGEAELVQMTEQQGSCNVAQALRSRGAYR